MPGSPCTGTSTHWRPSSASSRTAGACHQQALCIPPSVTWRLGIEGARQTLLFSRRPVACSAQRRADAALFTGPWTRVTFIQPSTACPQADQLSLQMNHRPRQHAPTAPLPDPTQIAAACHVCSVPRRPSLALHGHVATSAQIHQRDPHTPTHTAHNGSSTTTTNLRQCYRRQCWQFLHLSAQCAPGCRPSSLSVESI